MDEVGKPRPDILFTIESAGVKVFIGKQGLHYLFSRLDSTKSPSANQSLDVPFLNRFENTTITTYRLDVNLLGSNPNPRVVKENATGYYENYYLAHCPDGITGVNAFKKITLKEVYPGIDWVFYQHGSFMKYDFVVQPGADASLINLRFEGATELQLQEDGSLLINTPFGSITEQAPSSQMKSEEVFSKFRLTDSILSFDVENSESDTLIIDPIIEWGTYYGMGFDISSQCNVDSSGFVYLAGTTAGGTSSIAHKGFQNNFAGDFDAFLVKFDSTGKRIWATYYGGPNQDAGASCSADLNNNIYLARTTRSTSAISFAGHQVSHGGLQSPGSTDAFLVKFNSMGMRVWATYYGGNGYDHGYTCSTDQNFNVFLGGVTNSSNNIGFNGHQNIGGSPPYIFDNDGFLVKFDSSGARQWGTYYGTGTFVNLVVYSCVVDSMGNSFICGDVSSPIGDTSLSFNGHQRSPGGRKDIFIAKFDPFGNRLWSTYYGGQGVDGLYQPITDVKSCTVDKQGNFYLTGMTESNAGIASGGFKNSISGPSDCFLVKFSSSGIRKWATYYGGQGTDYGASCSIDRFENIYLLGYTESSEAISHHGFQNSLNGNSDAFLVKLDKYGNRLWGTYLGGEANEWPSSCVIDKWDNVYLEGNTGSYTGITYNGHQNVHSVAVYNAFLIKLKGCSSNGFDSVSACESFYWSLKDTTYTASGVYSDTTVGFKGCDSLVQLYLNIYQSAHTAQFIKECDKYTWPATGQTYFSSTLDTATLKSVYGCDSTVVLNLTIHNSTNSSITDTACLRYASPSGNFTWTESGTYTDVLTNAAGCDSVVTLNLHIKKVEVGITTTDSSFIANAIGATYQWFNCNQDYSKIPGETKRFYKPVFNGNYAVAVTKNGCTDTSACYAITAKESLDNPFGTSMAIYPNPTSGLVHVRFGKELNGLGTTIWNSAGKLVSIKNFETTDRFDLEVHWAAGVYYLKVSIGGGKSVVVKLVKI